MVWCLPNPSIHWCCKKNTLGRSDISMHRTAPTVSQMECREQEVPSPEGYEVGSQSAASRPACQEQCLLTPNCDAVAWSITQSMCYMKQGFPPGVAEWSTNENFDFCWRPGCPHATMVLASGVCDVLHNHQPSASFANFQELPPALHCCYCERLPP